MCSLVVAGAVSYRLGVGNVADQVQQQLDFVTLVADLQAGVTYFSECPPLQCDAVCCSALQCVAGCCSVLQCVAVCCSVLQQQLNFITLVADLQAGVTYFTECPPL